MSQLFLPILLLLSPFIGSFLGVVAMRIGRETLWGRSRCDACGHALSARDLVPVFSWLALGQKCRYCGVALSPFFPFVELAAVVPVVWAATLMQGWLLVITSSFGWLLLTLALIDWRVRRLPNVLSLSVAILGFVAAAVFDRAEFVGHIIGAAAGFALFAALALVYRAVRKRDGLGLGDAKLLGALGAWVSWEGLPAIVLLSSLAGLAYLAIRMLLLGTSDLGTLARQRLAFGPFLALAGWIVWLYGPLVLQ